MRRCDRHDLPGSAIGVREVFPRQLPQFLDRIDEAGGTDAPAQEAEREVLEGGGAVLPLCCRALDRRRVLLGLSVALRRAISLSARLSGVLGAPVQGNAYTYRRLVQIRLCLHHFQTEARQRRRTKPDGSAPRLRPSSQAKVSD